MTTVKAEPLVKTDREMILEAVRALRKKGAAARANFRCCSSCATAEAPHDRGMVYWHRQNDDSFYPKNGWSLRGQTQGDLCDDLHIGFVVPPGDYEDERSVELARTLIAELVEAGIDAERIDWNGSTLCKVGIKPKEVAVASA